MPTPSVSSHVVEHQGRPTTTLLMKFDALVLERQAHMEKK